MSSNNPQQFTFQKTLNLAAGATVSFQVSADKAPDVIAALVGNQPFPNRQITLGSISISAQAGEKLQFDSGAGNVSFTASASAFSGLGVYQDPASLLSDLSPDQNIAPGIDLSSQAGLFFMLLRWGYDLKGSAQGSLALGAPASVTFGASGSTEGLYAVIRQLPTSTGARTSIQDTLDSWMVPGQLKTIDDIAPGTWLVGELDGSLALQLGGQFGYQFNWVHQAQLAGLTGDIGLHLQIAANAMLNFSLGGKFAIVVGRDSVDPNSKSVRLRVFKLSQRSWGFALNLQVGVQGSTGTFLPSDLNHLIAALFGTSSAQVLADLQTIEKWTDPNQSLPDLLAGAGVDYALALIQNITGVDPKTEFEKARSIVLNFLNQWNALPNNVSSLVWKFVTDEVDLTPIINIAKAIVAGKQGLTPILDGLLSRFDFFTTPEGKWLESIAVNGILNALTNEAAFADLQKLAAQTLNVLDGGLLQQVLTKLQQWVDTKLDIQQIEKIVNQTSFDSLDAYLKAKLSAFLGHEINFADIDTVRKTINLVLSRAQQFYQAAVKALNQKYTAALAYTYQSSSSSSALLDVSFDFSKPGVLPFYQAAVSGDFTQLLVQQVDGVKLNVATLTHQLNRHSKVDLTLPFGSATADHLNTSLANINAIDEEDGRVFIYDLKAADTVTEQVIFRGKSLRSSSLTVGLNSKIGAGNNVRVHSTTAATYSYSFRQARTNLNLADAANQLRPYVQSYFSPVLPVETGDPQGSFGDWMNAFAQATTAGKTLGNTLISLDLSLPSAVAAAWLNAAPGSKDPVYGQMSIRLQQKLKQLIPFYYLSDPNKYREFPSIVPLLVYAAIPPATDASLAGDQLTLNRGTDIYWNWPDVDLRRAMAGSSLTETGVRASLGAAQDILMAYGMNDVAGNYGSGQGTYNNAIQAVTATDGDLKLQSLLLVEATVVREAQAAALALAKFRQTANSDPTKAVQALADFGSKVSDAFNSSITSIYGGGALRPLGTMAFAEAALAFDSTLQTSAAAILGVAVLKPAATFPPPGFPDLGSLKPADIVRQQQVLQTTAG